MTSQKTVPVSSTTTGEGGSTSPSVATAWKRAALLAGLAHAVLMTLAFDPVGAWPAALAAVSPLVWIAMSGRLAGARWWKALLWVWLGVLPFHLYQQAWVIDVSPIGYPLLAGYVALFPAVFAVLLGRVARRWPGWASPVTAGLVWTAIEVLRGDVILKGYGWFNIAHPMVEWPAAAAAAAVTGQFGVTFLVATIGSAAAELGREPRRVGHWLPAMAAAVAAWVGLSVLGPWGRTEESAKLRVGVVQTNLPQSNKQAPTLESALGLWDSLRTLTMEAATSKPDVIIWPETMKPGLALDKDSVRAERQASIALFPPKGEAGKPVLTASFAEATIELQRMVGVPLLVGEDAYDALRFETKPDGAISVHYDHRYNSAFLLQGGEVGAERYDKVRLTPFGEEMPYISAWPWLERQLLDLAARGMKLDLSSGSRLTVFRIPTAAGTEARLVTPICFEATEWDLCRRMVYEGPVRRADVLVNMTNDGWFGWWVGGRQQHLQIARWRCIELATPMIRAANTGISCSIDSRGRVTTIKAGPSGADWNAAGVLLADVAPGTGATLMARGGWMTSWVLLGLGVLIGAVSFIPRRDADRTTGTAGA